VVSKTDPYGRILDFLDRRKGTNSGKIQNKLTTKAYKLSYNCLNYTYTLSYNYINYTVNLVGRSFGKWRPRRLRSGGSRRVRRMPFGCAVRRAL
jgi:hypothetical protein